MTSHARSRTAKPKTAGKGKRCIIVFGPPGCGVTTICEVLKAASAEVDAIIPFDWLHSQHDIQDIASALHKSSAVVLVDVEGGSIRPDDVQELVDAGLLSYTDGAIIRVHASNEDCLVRTSSKPDYVTEEDLVAWHRDILEVEDMIRQHSLKYFMTVNDELEQAVTDMAIRVGLQK